jgi:spectinomycin phosphotransferase
MLIKPDLKDEEIVRCLRDAYGLTIEKVMFLPIGSDLNTRLFIALQLLTQPPTFLN